MSSAATPALADWAIRKAATEIAAITIDQDLKALLSGPLDAAAGELLRVTVDPEYRGWHAWQAEIPLARRLLALLKAWPVGHPTLTDRFESGYRAAVVAEAWAVAMEAVKIYKERNAVVATASAAMLSDGLWSP